MSHMLLQSTLDDTLAYSGIIVHATGAINEGNGSSKRWVVVEEMIRATDGADYLQISGLIQYFGEKDGTVQFMSSEEVWSIMHNVGDDVSLSVLHATKKVVDHLLG